MHQSTDEEPGGFKDRERSRPNATHTHTRQTLGAVGRVASRVRNSGMSKLTKANSFLQRQKDEEQQGVNESPWGVGVSAMEKNPSQESRQSNDIDKLPISPSGEGASDMVELSSPLSADQYSPLRLSESTTQRPMKEGESPRREHVGDRTAQHRIESDRKPEKRNDRTSAVLHAAGAARGLVKSVSKFGFRSSDRKSSSPEGAVNDLSKARSAMVMPVVDLKDIKVSKQLMAKRTSDAAEDSRRHRASAAEHDSPGALSQDEAGSETKMRGFFIPGLGRKSKLGADKSRNKTGLLQSTTTPHAPSPKTNSSGRVSPVNGSDSELSNDGKKSRKKKPLKDAEQKMRKGRASWFGFSSDSGESQNRGLAAGKGKSRARRQRSTGEHEMESEVGFRVSGKQSKDLSEMQDFAVDEYFDSEEDDMETGSVPRSMAEDDFITYQTGKGKKTQSNRNKSTMKPQT